MKTPREILLNRHRSAEPKLDAVRETALATAFPEPAHEAGTTTRITGPFALRLAFVLWRELVLPCRGVWAGLAAVWLVILMLNLTGGEKSTRLAARTTPPDKQVLAVLREQREMLTQFSEPIVPSPIIPTKTPGPRGELAQTTTLV